MNDPNGDSPTQQMSFIAVCVCSKVCTSRAGLTLHHRNCKKAQEAKKEGQPMTRDTDIVETETEYVKEVQDFVKMVNDMAIDAHKALTDGNKSAGRRARIALTAIRKATTPLRKNILEKMKGESSQEDTQGDTSE
jgi:hypothetical protein